MLESFRQDGGSGSVAVTAKDTGAMHIFSVKLQRDAAAYALTIESLMQDAMYETWSSGLDDWDSREYEDSELIDALYMVRLVLYSGSLARALGAASFLSCANTRLCSPSSYALDSEQGMHRH